MSSVIRGSLPSAASPARPAEVTLLVQPDVSHIKVGQTIHFLRVAAEAVTTQHFSLVLPRSAQLGALAGTAGKLNVEVRATTSSGVATAFGVVRYGSSTGGGAVQTSLNLDALRLDSTLRATPASGGPPGPPWNCDSLTAVSVTHDVQTRVGELHAASGSVSATYGYTKEADSTFTVGIAGATGGFSADGSVSVTNSTGVTANVTKSGAYRQYVDAHYDYTKFKETYSAECGYTYLTEATAWDSDVYPGPSQASENPYGGCKADPHGYSNLPKGGDWSSDRGTATSYDGTATVFGFTFGGHTGYTNDNHISYTNTGTQTFLCGNNAAPASAGIVYNSGN